MTDFIKLQGIFEDGYGIIAKKVMKDKTLHVIAKSIYSYICSYSGKGKDAFPSQSLICSDLDISKDTLAKYVKQLKEAGYITVKQEKEQGKFSKNVYTINFVPLPISSETVSTDTETIGNGQTDTNNNSINNNNNLNNNNINNKKIDTSAEAESLDQEKIKFREDLNRYISKVAEVTGKNTEEIRRVINPILLKGFDTAIILQKISESNFLSGKLDVKPKINNFCSKTMIDKILIGFYENREPKKTQNSKKLKILKENYNKEWW
ncbi:helix-turn-helix domain-containing protein [Cetobacterium sp. ZWU0022]|uniref:helix-turn-helix domain-containing protein n=1 Tax=Cetobacterium sp. ZWU0022 TaxID=1340502 RepID=UPI00068DB6AA|nr:helix-turn-helix domain-containing protein [Cetobacterium sp. ZWU0022]